MMPVNMQFRVKQIALLQFFLENWPIWRIAA